jgi:hypothetical protein
MLRSFTAAAFHQQKSKCWFAITPADTKFRHLDTSDHEKVMRLYTAHNSIKANPVYPKHTGLYEYKVFLN